MTYTEIANRIKEILIEVLQDDTLKADQIGDTAPFFGTEEEPGLIEDSLLILEIVSLIGDEFGIDPSDFDEDVFINVEKVAKLIVEKLK